MIAKPDGFFVTNNAKSAFDVTVVFRHYWMVVIVGVTYSTTVQSIMGLDSLTETCCSILFGKGNSIKIGESQSTKSNFPNCIMCASQIAEK